MIQHRIERRKKSLRIVLECDLEEALAQLQQGASARYGLRLSSYCTKVVADVLDVLVILDDEGELGIVKWFDESKGYGFIRTVESDDVFVHAKGLTGAALQQGQRVRFKRRQGRETTEAYDVTVEQADGSSG